METFLDILMWPIIVIGHLGLWCGIYNRIHATAWPRARRKLSEKVIFLITLLPMVWVLTVLLYKWTASLDAIYETSKIAFWYGMACLVISWFFILRWVYRKWSFKIPDVVVEKTSELINLRKKLGKPLIAGKTATLFGSLPGNQIQKLAIERMSIRLPGLPKSLDELRICQLSDLHFTGQMIEEYFEEVVRTANAFDPDLILITGDIVDKKGCLDWIERILGKLVARSGVYYVLGNHDLRIKDEKLLRTKLESQGIVGVGGKWKAVPLKDAVVLLAGNELPWYRGAENLSVEPDCEDFNGAPSIKILLSHSPDQIDWARKYKFDLILAGHTHGGQIRFPVIGPIVAPSKYGIKYCSGTFDIDGALMHVSRGLSGDDPIRLNCPPELGLFTLKA